MNGYVKMFKVKNENKDNKKKLVSLHKDDYKLLEKYKTIWNKIEELKKLIKLIKCLTSL